MFENYFKKIISLSEGEELKEIIHHHPITFLGTGIKIFLPLFTLLIVVAFIGTNFLEIILGLWFLSLISLIFLIIWVTAGIYHWYVWYFDVMILTNRRVAILQQKGIFEKKITEALYERIQDITFDFKGASQTIFRFGTIVVQTAGESPNLKLSDVRKPQEISRLIMKLRDKKTEKENLNKEKNQI